MAFNCLAADNLPALAISVSHYTLIVLVFNDKLKKAKFNAIK
jgi:hypothetical protein